MFQEMFIHNHQNKTTNKNNINNNSSSNNTNVKLRLGAAQTISRQAAVPENVVSDRGGNLTFGFGAQFVIAQPRDAYGLCWCSAEPSQGIQCERDEDYLARAGRLKIEGPTLGHEKECFLGQSCDIRGVDGIGLRSGDRLMVLEECGQGVSIPGFPGLGIAEANEPERCLYEFISDVGMPGNESILSSAAGIFRLSLLSRSGIGAV